MKINALFMPGIRLRKYKMYIPAHSNYKKYLFIGCLMVAAISGVVIYSINKDEINNEYSVMFSEFCNNVLYSTKSEVLLFLVKNMLPYIAVLLLLSTSAVGDILIYIFTFIKISGMSVFTTFLYTQYGLSGIKYAFSVFLPGKFILIIAIMILVDLCTKNSKDYRHKNKLSEPDIKKTGFVLLISCLIFLTSLLIDFLMLNIFLPASEILSLFG